MAAALWRGPVGGDEWGYATDTNGARFVNRKSARKVFKLKRRPLDAPKPRSQGATGHR